MIDLNNYVYDNGCCLLGSKKAIVNLTRQYMKKNEEEDLINEELINELADLKDDTICYVNYDNGMGYTIEYWQKDDKYEVIEELEVI